MAGGPSFNSDVSESKSSFSYLSSSSNNSDTNTQQRLVPSEKINYEVLTYEPRKGNVYDSEIRDFLQNKRQLDLGICVRYGVGYSLLKFKKETTTTTSSTANELSNSESSFDPSNTRANYTENEWEEDLCVTFPWLYI